MFQPKIKHLSCNENIMKKAIQLVEMLRNYIFIKNDIQIILLKANDIRNRIIRLNKKIFIINQIKFK